MKIKLTLADIFKRHDEPECQLLIQAIAIISTCTGYAALEPEMIFRLIKMQAEEVTKDNP